MRSLRVLPPGAPAATTITSAVVAGSPHRRRAGAHGKGREPVRTWKTASAGYRRALAAHQAARPTSQHQVQRDVAAAAEA